MASNGRRTVKARPECVVAARQAVREFSGRLRLVRDLRGLSLGQVEKITGGALDRGKLSRFENPTGRANPSLTMMLLLAIAYDCDIHIRRDGTIEVTGTNLQRLMSEADNGKGRR